MLCVKKIIIVDNQKKKTKLKKKIFLIFIKSQKYVI